jgi:hypothetical protein
MIAVEIPKWISQKIGFDSQVFYRSTDTSNSYGFPDTYFPFYGIESNGVVIKGRSTEIQSIGSRPYNWRVKLCEMMSKSGFDENCKNQFPVIYYQAIGSDKWSEKCCDLFVNFLDKFTDWWQLRESASIGGGMWDRPDFNYLRDLTYMYQWSPPTLYDYPNEKDFSNEEEFFHFMDSIEYSLPESQSGVFVEIPQPDISVIDVPETDLNCVESDINSINDWVRNIKAITNYNGEFSNKITVWS